MTEAVPESNPARIRASRACQRCSRRKIKCDGFAFGLPCSRCRSDGVNDCKLSDSRRGCHRRKRGLGPPQNNAAGEPRQEDSQNVSGTQRILVADAENSSGDKHEVNPRSQRNHAFRDATTRDSSDTRSMLEEAANTGDLADYNSSQSTQMSDLGNARGGTMFDQQAVARTTPTTDGATASRSLAGIFEEFLIRKGSAKDGLAERYNFILLSESSPLTFALEEIQQDNVNTGFHEGDLGLPNQATIGDGLADPQQHLHPSHMSSNDIAYLQSKGTFDLPEADILKALIDAFSSRFYPLYSIVNKEEFELLYSQQKLPWILLHSVCFIGATFCDQNVIYQSTLKRRCQARQVFYEKAKTLFDVGYETNKIVLLQSVVMLTFWGPHIKSYWNPSSWVDFATTIAASLGIHRNSSLAGMNNKDRSLLRRLWWTVTARDASCATLLGRPFRIRMSQCDSDMLALQDFNHELSASRSDTDECVSQVSALYQINMAKLSLILRQIVRFQSSGDQYSEKRSELHALLKKWQSELPEAIDWSRQPDSTNLFATSLKIIFHHHLILIYLGKPEQSMNCVDQSINSTTSPAQIAASAAQVISSSALALMTNSSVKSMPHEIFQGYFIAGIVFYRQIHRQQTLLAQLRRSALDNCQMILNDARENCDAAQWMMCIFDFLLSSTSELGGLRPCASSAVNSFTASSTQNGIVVDSATRLTDDQLDLSNPSLYSIDWNLPLQQDTASMVDDLFFIPNLHIPAGGTPFDLRF